MRRRGEQEDVGVDALGLADGVAEQAGGKAVFGSVGDRDGFDRGGVEGLVGSKLDGLGLREEFQGGEGGEAETEDEGDEE